jgi:head-tail adaptor
MMGPVRFSEYDSQIVIESAATSNDAVTNEKEETWSTFKTVWSKELRASREAIEAQQQVAVTTGRWAIRRDATITERMRINKSSVYYYISGIEDFGRQGYMILTAEKRDNV